MTRRDFLFLFACLALAAPRPVSARNGSDDSGSDNSGSGSDDHSGHGRGGDGNGGDDHGGDDDSGGGDDKSGSGRESSGRSLSQDEVLDAVRSGRIISLKRALEIVSDKVGGRVIDIGLTSRMGRAQYRVTVRRADGAVKTVRLDARTGHFVGFLGF
ncbi:putative membrane protein YkoI [Pararhizobium capsulatum DSM 1112]|uniref:Membrane protein YkoI n=1 Tax=Pararhizobium capsulatum DSM 1112 TaxID=1121113 RepID=A0ABU0BNJ0_9HYPH|nr:PepSY domain-containing protein [Pararhizobium capsulatum]MDQ0319825.1 putative membrane protein YkoI [Pararhizobium capsulatum DSM 1112]